MRSTSEHDRSIVVDDDPLTMLRTENDPLREDLENRSIRSRSVTIGDENGPKKELGSHIDISGEHLLSMNDELAEANERLRQFSYTRLPRSPFTVELQDRSSRSAGR